MKFSMKRKEEANFTEIVESTKGVVLSAIGKTLDAEFSSHIDDVVQETYLRAYKSLKKEQFKNNSSLETWLYAIARNESLRMNEKLIRERKKSENLAESMSSFDAVEKSVEQKSEEGSLLTTLLEKLPEKYRRVIELDIQGYRDQQIAQELQISVGTVKSRNSRGREKLRQIALAREISG